jgi:hypothetical protein
VRPDWGTSQRADLQTQRGAQIDFLEAGEESVSTVLYFGHGVESVPSEKVAGLQRYCLDAAFALFSLQQTA